jgi:hypothetical protein
MVLAAENSLILTRQIGDATRIYPASKAAKVLRFAIHCLTNIPARLL